MLSCTNLNLVSHVLVCLEVGKVLYQSIYCRFCYYRMNDCMVSLMYAGKNVLLTPFLYGNDLRNMSVAVAGSCDGRDEEI